VSSETAREVVPELRLYRGPCDAVIQRSISRNNTQHADPSSAPIGAHLWDGWWNAVIFCLMSRITDFHPSTSNSRESSGRSELQSRSQMGRREGCQIFSASRSWRRWVVATFSGLLDDTSMMTLWTGCLWATNTSERQRRRNMAKSQGGVKGFAIILRCASQ
jgi:hypothetical protein